MEDWRTLYQQKLTTAEEAVKHIKSGDRVVVTHATGEPILLTDAMVANAEQYENVEVVHMVAMGKAEYCLPENSKHFRHNSLFLGGSTRKAIEEGRGDFTPVFFSEIPELFRTNLHPNVVLLHLSTPDEHGYCTPRCPAPWAIASSMSASWITSWSRRLTSSSCRLPISAMWSAPSARISPPW